MNSWIRTNLSIETPIQVVLLAALCWYVFNDAGEHGFAFDDEDYIATAAAAKEDWTRLLNPQLGEPWESRIGVHLYAYMVHDRYGINPRPYHLVNVWVHLINAVLVMFLARRLQGNRQLSFIAALLFLVGSCHYRVVFWISAISFGFGLCFLLICLLLCSHWFDSDDGRNGRWLLAASVGAFFLSMLFHQAFGIAALLPALLALDRGLSRRLQGGMLAAFGVPGIAILLVERLAYDGAYTAQPAYSLFGWHVFSHLVHYFYDLFVGTYVNIGPYDQPLWLVVVVGAAAALLTLLLAGWRQSRFWAAWTLLTVLPFLFWDRADTFSRYHYAPAVGSSVLIAMAITSGQLWVRRRWGSVPARSAAGILLLAMIGVNAVSIERMQSEQYYDAGKYQLSNGNPLASVHPFKQALLSDPEALPKVYLRLADAYQRLGRMDEARGVLIEGRKKYPGSKALEFMLSDYERPRVRRRR